MLTIRAKMQQPFNLPLSPWSRLACGKIKLVNSVRFSPKSLSLSFKHINYTSCSKEERIITLHLSLSSWNYQRWIKRLSHIVKKNTQTPIRFRDYRKVNISLIFNFLIVNYYFLNYNSHFKSNGKLINILFIRVPS